jgi:hypothetical protein
MRRTSIGYLCAAILLGGVTLGQAVRADGLDGLYAGGNFGRAHNDYDTAFVDDQLKSEATAAGDVLKPSSSSVRRDDNTWWVDAGYMPWTYFGIDAAFIHLGELTHRLSGTLETLSANDSIIETASVTSHGPALSLVARVPLAESLDLDVRIGDYYGKTTLTTVLYLNSKSTSLVQSTSTSSLLVSVGGAYTFAGHWSIRLDYLRVNQAGDDKTVGKYNVNAASAGVAFTF